MDISYTHKQLVHGAKFSNSDLEEIRNCRRDYNQLGFGYQLACVRLLNRFPIGHPLEVMNDILDYVSTQLNIPSQNISLYAEWQKTVVQHQERIRAYLSLRSFMSAIVEIEAFLLNEAYHLEQTVALTARLREFLRTQRILEPAPNTMYRLIQAQRETARTEIYNKVAGKLCDETRHYLDGLS